ncbi:bifunctional phosphopantothenoylcysteine decarboxylase/phosphopantothenate--cysteine ligase CoaBC [Ravibacter arvi]|uniref:Coenzyme A biosynthesis bifunctional protein CoaBC n=1 Tax=Ravibacter arvi TaxID=2051041 RepID=A0ABP8M6R2_9BACT
MKPLQSKKILIGVTGSIAAYKVCHLVRLLVKEGAEVRVIMTASARDFVTPLTLSTLSKNPVLGSFFEDRETGVWNNHVELGLWADILLIAPATAHTLAKCANGICDDLLQAVYLSMRSGVYFAPAMDLDMLQHPATQANLDRIRSFGNRVINPGYGELASGLTGAGRMAEPEEILQVLTVHFSARPEAAGKKVLITAGPTQEDLDPVRFISNHSSGKMGYALAKAFSNAGCEVTVIAGPVKLAAPEVSEFVPVRSAREMYEATVSRFEKFDLIIFAAAVADYAPAHKAPEKIKKDGDTLSLDLVKTIDIAATIGRSRLSHQLLMGFALETQHELENAKAKLAKKNFDFVVLNSLKDAGAGFGHETNKIRVIDREQNVTTFDLKPKNEVANDLLEIILNKWQKEQQFS